MIRDHESPTLPHGCNSWIVVRRSTGQPAFETTSRAVIRNLNPEHAEVWTAQAWLANLNRKAPQEGQK